MNWLTSLKNNWQQRSLTRPELAPMFVAPTPDAQQWVAIDCEMTGLNPKKHHILSVAAIHINGNHIDTGNGLYLVCRPPVMPDRDTITIHGLRPRDVEHGIDYDTMLSLLLPFMGNRAIVGFCPQLDMAFLNPLAKAYMGVALPNQIVDVHELHNRRTGNRTEGVASQANHLNNILSKYRIPDLGGHNAYNDAVMTAMAFLHMR